MPLILALGRQRQVDLCDFKACLIYIVSFRPAGTRGKTLSQKDKKKNAAEKMVVLGRQTRQSDTTHLKWWVWI